MTNRLNNLETYLKADLSAESDITNVFDFIDSEIREKASFFKTHELPALVFEFTELDNADINDANDIYEWAYFTMYAIGEDTSDAKTARQAGKQYVSLVRDFMKSTSWRYAYDTVLDRSGFLIAEMKTTALRPVVVIPGRVKVLLNDNAKN